jgi:hypothetical protein
MPWAGSKGKRELRALANLTVNGYGDLMCLGDVLNNG